MATNWADDVKRYVTNADDEVISAIVKYCGIALQNKDSSLVSFTDPVETDRVRENYLKKKLGLTHSDADLDTAIAAVGDRMKGDNFKNRVTVYYLLLEQFGMLDFFRKGAAVAAGAVGAGAAAAGLAAASTTRVEAPAAVVADTTTSAPYKAVSNDYDNSAYVEEEKSGLGWLWWLLGLLALGALAWWFFNRTPAAAPVEGTTAGTETTVPAEGTPAPVDGPVDFATVPAEGGTTVKIPEGASVMSELRDTKPVVKVYFDTAKTEVAPAFAGAAAGLKTYLEGHSGSTLAVSGFNDPRGNAAQNAELSKGRAEAVKAELVKAGIADASIELVQPAASTDTTVDNATARRVEVVVK